MFGLGCYTTPLKEATPSKYGGFGVHAFPFNREGDQFGVIFSASKKILQDLKDLDGLLLLFEGGRWIWPGVREGFRRTLRLPANDSQVESETSLREWRALTNED